MQTVKLKKSCNYLILSLTSVLVFSSPVFATDKGTANQYASNSESSIATQLSSTSNFTDAELAQMLAPIALYPDTLLSHILIATTYPIEVVDAERWLSKNNQLSVQSLADAAQDKDWDASVKALLPFPNILKKLSEDLHWMRNLGDAFLQDEAQVLANVQTLRRKADQAGNLSNMDNVQVVRQPKTIIIESRQPDVIYVPYYDTRVVYGHWGWSHYPPIYWHQPVHLTTHIGPYYWDNPVHLAVGLFFGAVHWNNRHVVVHQSKSRYYKHHSNKKLSTSYQAKRWHHNPRHRKGVAYRSSNMQKKYRSHTPSVQQHNAVRLKHKALVNKNKAVGKHANRKYSSDKSQRLNQKLQVNRAVKMDKHNDRNQLQTKNEAYKNSKWRQTKGNSHSYRDKVQSVNSNKSSAQHSKNEYNRSEHSAVKSSEKQDSYTSSNKVFSNKGQVEKNYAKPSNNAKNTGQKKSNYKREKSINKPSNAKVSNRQKSSGNRSHQSRAKQHN